MLAKIRVRRVVALTVATLGVYGIVWLAKRRNEIVNNHKLPIPHWLWIVLPILLTLAFVLPFAVLLAAINTSTEVVTLWICGFLLLGTLVSWGVCIWWMFAFGRAIGRITSGRLTMQWVVLHWIVWGPFVAGVVQYYLNRVSSKTLDKKQRFRPSQKFTSLSTVSFVAVAALSVMSSWAYPDFFSLIDQQWLTESQEIDRKLKETEDLSRQHTECVGRMHRDYPEVTFANEESYRQVYDACERLRIRQNEAVDEYEALIDKI